MPPTDIPALVRSLRHRATSAVASYNRETQAVMLRAADELERLAAENEQRRDEADRERLDRRQRDQWLAGIAEIIKPHRPRVVWDGSPDSLPRMVRLTIERLRSRAFPPCPKCGGEGWVWQYELDEPYDSTGDIGNTKHTCDRCKGSEVAIGDELERLKAENAVLREELTNLTKAGEEQR